MKHSDRAVCVTPTAVKIIIIRGMGIYDSDKLHAEAQLKIPKIGMSKIALTKKYHPDGSFD